MVCRVIKVNRVKSVLICLLVLAGMVGCGGGQEVPTPASQSSSGIVVQLTEEEMTAQADLIVAGHVSDVSCYEGGDGGIYTEVTCMWSAKVGQFSHLR